MAKEKRKVCGMVLEWEQGASAIPGTTYVTIAYIAEYTSPGIVNTEVDTSSLDDCLAETRGARTEPQQAEFLMFLDNTDANDQALRTSAANQEVSAWKVTWPDPDTNSPYEEFLGWILSFEPQPVTQESYIQARLVVRVVEPGITYGANP
jgi:hypothetical protein